MAYPQNMQNGENQTFRALVELLPAGVFVQTKGVFSYLNQEAQRILGPREELLGHPVLDRIPADDRPRIAGRIDRLNRLREPVEKAEVRFLRPGREPVEAEVSAVPFDFEGEAGALVFLRDLTLEKAGQRALQEEKERLAVTLRSIVEAVITTRPDGCIDLMNPSAEAMTGWSAAEAKDQPLDLVLCLKEAWTGTPLSPLSRPLPASARVIQCSKNGAELPVGVKTAPMADPRGQVAGTVLVITDLTEQNQLEEALRRQENLESIGLQAGGIAHDFNNLLSGIFSQVQLALLRIASSQTDQARVPLERTMEVIARAKNLTGQLLSFSRKHETTRTRIELGTLVRMTALFALTGSNIEVEFSIADELFPCEGDQWLLAQAIDNVVLNARQALGHQGRLAVGVENRVTKGEKSLVVTIQDYGPGMPAEVLSRIFDPYFTTKKSGSGLGLSGVKTIVERHGGRVEVESVPGYGTTFRLCFPAA